jgi:hypothetical protein
MGTEQERRAGNHNSRAKRTTGTGKKAGEEWDLKEGQG